MKDRLDTRQTSTKLQSSDDDSVIVIDDQDAEQQTREKEWMYSVRMFVNYNLIPFNPIELNHGLLVAKQDMSTVIPALVRATL